MTRLEEKEWMGKIACRSRAGWFFAERSIVGAYFLKAKVLCPDRPRPANGHPAKFHPGESPPTSTCPVRNDPA